MQWVWEIQVESNSATHPLQTSTCKRKLAPNWYKFGNNHQKPSQNLFFRRHHLQLQGEVCWMAKEAGSLLWSYIPYLHVVLRNSWGAPHGFVWQGKYMVIQNWNYMSSIRLKFCLHNFSWMQEFAEVVIDYWSPANKHEKSCLAHWWWLVFNICRILQSRFWASSIEPAAECDKLLIQKTGKEPAPISVVGIKIFFVCQLSFSKLEEDLDPIIFDLWVLTL